jgi:peptidoglycan/xylan/chitin deacetylase (PgdA/CDA1 family)
MRRLLALVAATLTAAIGPAASQAAFAPPPPWQSGVAVLNYHGITNLGGDDNTTAAAFASQLRMLHDIGAHTISPAQLVAFLHGAGTLPSRPVLITFDDGRTDSYTGADALLRRYGFRATMFVIANKPGSERFFLGWGQLRTMARSGRWDLQLHAGTGHVLVQTDAKGAQGPSYANRIYDPAGGLESFAHWRKRVTSDLLAAAATIAHNVPGFRATLFAPPYGDYGQVTSNDPRIQAFLLPWLEQHFAAVFVQTHPAFATASQPLIQRLAIHSDTTAGALYDWLVRQDPGT